jgi:DNA helicase II / ATP-dependent DNA helicase PcrA
VASSPHDLTSGLNPAQLAAVTATEGPLLIMAGAGSGKTRVITRRIAYLVATGVPPQAILAVTFTNKAAREMQHRVETLLGRGGALLSTFHGFGSRLLRMEAARLGLPPSFSLYDRADSEAVVKTCLQELGLSAESHPAGGALEAIGRWKSRLMRPADAAAAAVSREDEGFAAIYATYEAALQRSSALDFDDLLCKTVWLLESSEEVRAAVNGRFRHLLVDEYQDVNEAQYRLTRLLGDASRNVCVTGDPDQCIYSWRGADISYILDFQRDYPDAKVVRLEQNYRSVNTVLKAASHVIKFNDRRGDKELWSELGAGEPITIQRVADDVDEARVVVQRIQSLRQSGARLADCAIFYRLNSLSYPIEQALVAARIPYQVVAGLEFFKRKEVKDIIAYLRFLTNFDDEVSLARVVNTPARGLGDKTIDLLRGFARDAGLSLGALLQRPDLLAGRLSARAAAAVEVFRRLAADLADLATGGSTARIIAEVVQQSGYDRYIAGKANESGADPLGNIQQLIGAAQRYDQNPESRGLAGFLEDVALQSDVDTYDTEIDKVVLMTLHSAKGLEFPHVFLVGCDSEIFPHRGVRRVADVEEERRLFYVGLTRAMRSVHLLTAGSRSRFGRPTYSTPSLFLSEIPEELSVVLDDTSGLATASISTRVTYDLEDEQFAVRRGARVSHKAYGWGTVRSIRGRGGDARVEVDFDEAGQKQLVLRYAGLTVIDASYE